MDSGLHAPLTDVRKAELSAYVVSLDGVRAIAILAVLTFHAGIVGMPGGYLGVDVFFVLSGFLITSLLLAEFDAGKRIDLLGFYGRRIRRLLPGLAFMAIVAIGLADFVAIDAVARTSRDLPAAVLGWMNWRLIFDHQSYFESFGRPPLLLHTWSLAVEAQFYVVWPLLVVLTARIGGARAVGIGAAALCIVQTVRVGYDPNFASAAVQSHFYYGSDIRSIGLFIGALLAASMAARKPLPRSLPVVVRNVAAVVALAGLVALFHTADRSNHGAYVFGFVMTAIVTSILIASVASRGTAVGAILSTVPARWLGTRSYSIYLWHWPIFQVMRPGIDFTMNANEANVLRLAVTIAVAELSYRSIEAPFRSIRLSQVGALFKNDDFATMLGACTCVILIVVAAGMTQLLGSRDQHRRDAAFAAMLRTPPPYRRQSVTHRPASGFGYETEDTTLLGDSIMLAASRAIAKRFKVVYVDAMVGRQAETLGTVISRLHAQRQLTPIVIFDIGNNGTVNATTLETMLKNLSSCRGVIVVNAHVPRPWAHDANAVVNRVAPHHKNTVVAQWYRAATGHDADYLGEDHVHPNDVGARAYAQTIVTALRALRRANRPELLKLAKRNQSAVRFPAQSGARRGKREE